MSRESDPHLGEWASQKVAALVDYRAPDWIHDIGDVAKAGSDDRFEIGSRNWLMSLVEDSDERLILRAVLCARPDDLVTLDLTDLVDEGWVPDPPTDVCSAALETMQATAGSYAPLVVLTEGSSDIEVLSSGLRVLYPHLTDLVRFMDYGAGAEGGAGALVRTIRAFAAAGIVNRVVAVFDNDTAATEALRSLDREGLPLGIRVLQYPPIQLASNYPTVGAPTTDAPTGHVARSDVNGLAGSIELYLGRDVLTKQDGQLHPVHWRTYIPHIAQYQGEIEDKAALLGRFRKKVHAASRNPELLTKLDWSGVQAILDMIRAAFD